MSSGDYEHTDNNTPRTSSVTDLPPPIITDGPLTIAATDTLFIVLPDSLGLPAPLSALLWFQFRAKCVEYCEI